MEYANQSDTPEQKKKGKYESIGRETTVRSTKKDIVDQIKEMYIDRTQVSIYFQLFKIIVLLIDINLKI